MRESLKAALRRRIVGQDQAIEKVVEIYQMFLAGLNAPGRPVGKPVVFGAYGIGQDPCGRSHGRGSVRRRACLHQD